MANLVTTYRFGLPDGSEETFRLEIDEDSLMLVRKQDPEDLPAWTRLDFNTCPNCTLDNAAHTHCPLAESLVPIVKGFKRVLSYDELFVEVVTEERTITQHISAQRSLSSFMGLVIATCGCPHTIYFRPMAKFHLPLASEEETLYRATSMYLLSQYFIQQEGRPPDWNLKGLEDIYHQVQIVNMAVAERLRTASKSDSSVNALIVLDMYARAVPCVMEESLDELRYIFNAYL